VSTAARVPTEVAEALDVDVAWADFSALIQGLLLRLMQREAEQQMAAASEGEET
jgi:hypothetical protein